MHRGTLQREIDDVQKRIDALYWQWANMAMSGVRQGRLDQCRAKITRLETKRQRLVNLRAMGGGKGPRYRTNHGPRRRA